MISRNKGILSLEFLIPLIAILCAVVVVESCYRLYVRPHAVDFMLKRTLIMAQHGADQEIVKERPLYVIIKDREPEFEIIFCLWGMIVLSYKLGHVTRERRLF